MMIKEKLVSLLLVTAVNDLLQLSELQHNGLTFVVGLIFSICV